MLFKELLGSLGFRASMVSCLALVTLPTSVSAQAHWQPRPAPLVTADNEPWFRLGEPITFEGYVYYPAGARVFFDGNVMVRSGAFRGIPLYIDTTIEAYSRVFVPVTAGQLQPYERRRIGDAAGTTGSRAPSFPVSIAGEAASEPAAVAMAGESALASPAKAADTKQGTNIVTPTSGIARAPRNVVEAGLRPKGLNEVYVTYSGMRWRVAGKAVPRDDARFKQIGRSGNFPVLAERDQAHDPHIIYLPSRSGFVTPYEKAGKPPRY